MGNTIKRIDEMLLEGVSAPNPAGAPAEMGKGSLDLRNLEFKVSFELRIDPYTAAQLISDLGWTAGTPTNNAGGSD